MTGGMIFSGDAVAPPPPPSSEDMIILVDVTSVSPPFFGDVSLPIADHTFNITVDWGDGNSNVYTTGNTVNHAYGATGNYTVTISGSLDGFGVSFLSNGIGRFATAVTSFGNLGITDLQYAFHDWDNLIAVPNTLPTIVTTLSNCFSFCNNFNDGNVGLWDVGNVTDMSYMFRDAPAFNQDIGNWNVGNVTDMTAMFAFATIFDQDLTGWCVTTITTEPANFATGSALDANNYPVWGTCP